jgi:hypothetical protein
VGGGGRELVVQPLGEEDHQGQFCRPWCDLLMCEECVLFMKMFFFVGRCGRCDCCSFGFGSLLFFSCVDLNSSELQKMFQ